LIVTIYELEGRPVQIQGHPLAERLLGAAGWRIEFSGLPARQGVVVVYPHTSNWDFVVGVLAKWSLGFPLAFWGKDSLFRVPLLGRWMRWLGGVPVDRSSTQGAARQMVERMKLARERNEFFWLALAPEGSRSRGEYWRSGFYHVAHGARVPLGLAYLDFRERVVSLDRFIHLSGDIESDMAVIAAYLADRRGKRPELATPVRMSPSQR
jgi:1-acyl-sn-glycerol-3-phosphate acyltransferase